MYKYEVRNVVCDYGIYENDKLVLILNSRRIACEIVDLLKSDYSINHGTWGYEREEFRILFDFGVKPCST